MKPCRAWPEAVLMSRPPCPCLRMRRIASWQQRKTPLVLTSKTLSQSASLSSSILAMVMTPAFWIEMSTRPKCASAASYKPTTLALSVTSPTKLAAFPPSPEIAAAISFTRVSLALTRTAAPSWAKRRAIEAPMPRLAPVTTTVLPEKRELETVMGVSLRVPGRGFSDGLICHEPFGRQIVGDQDIDVAANQGAADCLGLAGTSGDRDDTLGLLHLIERDADHALVERRDDGFAGCIEETKAHITYCTLRRKFVQFFACEYISGICQHLGG